MHNSVNELTRAFGLAPLSSRIATIPSEFREIASYMQTNKSTKTVIKLCIHKLHYLFRSHFLPVKPCCQHCLTTPQLLHKESTAQQPLCAL